MFLQCKIVHDLNFCGFTSILRHWKTQHVKLNIENDNVALTLSNVVHINIEMLNDVDRRFKFQRWNTQRCFNADLTLSHVVMLYQPKNNVGTTSKCFLGFNTYQWFKSHIVVLESLMNTDSNWIK